MFTMLSRESKGFVLIMGVRSRSWHNGMRIGHCALYRRLDSCMDRCYGDCMTETILEQVFFISLRRKSEIVRNDKF